MTMSPNQTTQQGQDPIKELEQDIKNAMEKAIIQSDLGELFRRKNLSDGAIRVEFIVDLTKVPNQTIENENADVVEAEKLKDALLKMPGDKLTLASCCPHGLNCLTC